VEIAYQPNVQSPPAIPFIRDVANLYHRNAWLFLKILLPAACFGWLIITLSWQQATDIQRQLPHGPELEHHERELLEIVFFRWFGFAVDWILYCFAFAATCVAVSKLAKDEQARADDCFGPVREKMGGFLRLTIALGLCVFGSLAAAFTFLAVIVITSHYRISALNRDQIAVLTTSVIGMFFWGVSRFGLAMPGLILNGEGVWNAFRRSWRLTAGCWSILGLLLLESVGGALLAYKAPIWILHLAYSHRLASTWMWWAASLVGFALGLLLQPHMPVGFALLYLRRSNDLP